MPEMRDSLIQFVGFFTASLKDGVDREVALTQLMAELHAEHSRGIGDAVDVCKQVAAGRPEKGATIMILASALQDLIARNDASHDATIHSW